MKIKINLLIVLFSIILLSFGCKKEYNGIEDVECPIELATYVYEECMGLPTYSSFSTMFITEKSKGKIIFTKEILEDYDYKKVNYQYNLDTGILFFMGTLEKNISVVRYDIYLNDEFTYQSIVIGKKDDVYLYQLGKTKDDVYVIQEVTKLRKIIDYDMRVENLNAVSNINSKELFLEVLNDINSLDSTSSSYKSDVIRYLNKLKYGFGRVDEVFQNYFIGHNILFTCLIDNKEIILELSYHKDGEILLINNTVEEFVEFVNRYYDNSYYGKYINENDYLNINLRDDYFTSFIDSNIDGGSFVKEDEYFAFRIYGNLSVYYFKYEDEEEYRTLTYDLEKSVIVEEDVSKLILEDKAVFKQIKK